MHYFNSDKTFNTENQNILVSRLLRAVKQIASKEEEICGFFYEDGSVQPCINYAENVKENWLIAGKDFYVNYHTASIKPIGIYHTHISDNSFDRLTVKDILPANKLGLQSFVYNVATDKYDYYDPNFVYPFPLSYTNQDPKALDFYLNWRWLWGRSDCLALLRSFYCGFLDIPLSDGNRTFDEAEFLDNRWSKIQDNYDQFGFVSYPKTEKIQLYDVLSFSVESIALHHLAIVVKTKPIMFLHAISNKKPSSLQLLTNYWQGCLRSIFRYKEFTNL